MVKGVNRRIIEINDTGNEMFEKIVLYVTPKYSQCTTKKLRQSARDVIYNFTSKKSMYRPIRKTYKMRRVIRFFFVLGGILAVGGIILSIIL